jgi:hypothetical protein
MIPTYSISVDRKCGLNVGIHGTLCLSPHHPVTSASSEVLHQNSEEVHIAWWMGKTFPAISFPELHSDIGCTVPGIVFGKALLSMSSTVCFILTVPWTCSNKVQ